MSKAGLFSLPSNLADGLAPEIKLVWDHLPRDQQVHELERARESLAWREGPGKQWCQFVEQHIKTQGAVEHYYHRRLFGRILSANEIIEYLCAEHGMAYPNAGRVTTPELIEILQQSCREKEVTELGSSKQSSKNRAEGLSSLPPDFFDPGDCRTIQEFRSWCERKRGVILKVRAASRSSKILPGDSPIPSPYRDEIAKLCRNHLVAFGAPQPEIPVLPDHPSSDQVDELLSWALGWCQKTPSNQELIVGEARPRGQKAAKKKNCPKNHYRDKWVTRRRRKKTPDPWDEIYDDLRRLAAKKGWDCPSSAKALAEASYRFEKRERQLKHG